MEELVRHTWMLFMDVLENWPALVIVSGILSWVFRRFSKKQEEQLKLIRIEIKRVELMQAIDHDYGLRIASGILDEYVAMGGNHYAHEIYERYKKEKEK